MVVITILDKRFSLNFRGKRVSTDSVLLDKMKRELINDSKVYLTE